MECVMQNGNVQKLKCVQARMIILCEPENRANIENIWPDVCKYELTDVHLIGFHMYMYADYAILESCVYLSERRM